MQQLNFLRTQCDPLLCSRLLDGLPEAVRSDLFSLKPAEWYPRSYSVAVLNAIASHHGGDEEAAKNDLKRCGTFIANEATNTFLKLLMKILTPKLFFKKLPEFWARDQKGGHFEVDVDSGTANSLELRLCDVEGFDHIAAISLGFISFGLTAMGKQNVNVEQQGWSLARPGPKEIIFQVSWS
jgi:hypothetical protein